MYDCMVCAWNIAPSEAKRCTPADYWRWYNIRHPSDKQLAAQKRAEKVRKVARIDRMVEAWRKQRAKLRS